MVTYNVRNGFVDAPQRRSDVVALLARLKPDIVALQELNGYTEGALRRDAAGWGHEHVLVLKRTGYPTGLTSTRPFTRVKKLLRGMHHGAVVAETHGVVVVSTHLSPFDASKRLSEVDKLLAALPHNVPVLLAGDLNAIAPGDASRVTPWALDALRGDGPNNLVDGAADTRVVSRLLRAGFMDLGASDGRTQPTAPTPLARRPGESRAHVLRRQLRIDFIFASKRLAARCGQATSIRTRTTERLSDHYPVMVDCH